MDCVAVVEILVLGAVLVVEVVELVVRCVFGHVVRLVVWCVNGSGWFPLWYGDLGRCIVGCDGGCWVFYLFPAWLFGGYDGCERGDGTCGWCGGLGWCDGVGVVEVFCSVAMGVGNRGRSV